MGFHISRQRHYENNQLCVEIAVGGSKYAGKDILPIKFNGEQKNLVSPADAINVAIRIIDEWNLSYFDEPKMIALVNADGKGNRIYFDPNNKKDISILQQWADKTLKSMSKCASCQKPIGNTSRAYETPDLPNRICCQESCLANIYRTIFGVEMPRVASNKDKKAKPAP